MDDKIVDRQYARKGYSTTDGLLCMLQAVSEAGDSGEVSARLFFTDFTNRFHLIDHTIGLPDQPVASC